MINLCYGQLFHLVMHGDSFLAIFKLMLNNDELYIFLEEKATLYNRPEFIKDDPIQIPHRFDRREDVEISGFLVALFAWGNRKMILNNGFRLMERMDYAPYDFILTASRTDMDRLMDFVHRTFNSIDLIAVINVLRSIYLHEGGLEEVVYKGYVQAGNVFDGLVNLHQTFMTNDFPQRSRKHIANVARGSSAKRLNMFLRWMVRTDKAGVDFGIWTKISPSALMLPLDVHTGRSARLLGMLQRKLNDWKAVEEVTERLRKFDPDDPVKYDFALFGLGVDKHF